MWWDKQNNLTKAQFRNLVVEERFSFMSGGMSSSDEATPLWSDVIENIKVGNDFLMREFGIQPKVAWHADAFGHSAETPHLFQQLGFEAFFFGRIDDQKK